MNGITSVSFQETRNGLQVHVRKSQKSKSSSSGKLKKRLPYNFKQISKQIMQSKRADEARPLVTKIRVKLSWLKRQLKNGEYGDNEIAAAIIHAAAMERIAKRKVRHLEEEELAEGAGGASSKGVEYDEEEGKDEIKEILEESEEISEELMQKVMEEIEELEKELKDDMFSELSDITGLARGDLSEEEIEQMKRKHRQDEEKQLTRADLKYLKSLFDRLEQEKREAASGMIQNSFNSPSNLSFVVESLPAVEMTESNIGETVDTTV